MDRRRYLRAVGGGAGLALAGCLGDVGGDGGGGLPDTVTIGYPSPALPVYNFALFPGLADRLAEAGVETELEIFSGYTPMVGGFVQGEMHMGVLSLTSLVKARAQNFPVVAPVGYTQQFAFALITGRDVTDWEALRGGTVAVHDPSAISTVTGRLMVKETLGSEDAVTYEYIIGTPNRLAALKSGRVDAAVVFTSGALQAETDGYARILGVPWEFDRLSRQTTAALVTLEETVSEETGTIRAIVEAMVETYDGLYEADPATVTEAALASGHFSPFDTDVWEEAFGQVRDVEIWPRGGGLSASNIEKAQDVLVETGLIEPDQRLARADFVDDRFL